MSARDKADDIVARQGVTAPREFNQHVVHALYGDAVTALALGRFDLCRQNFGFLFLRAVIFVIFLFDVGHQTNHRYPAEADGGIKIVQIVKPLPCGEIADEFVVFFFRQADIIAAEFALNFQLSFGNVFITLFIFEPRTDFIACRAGFGNREPVARRPFSLLGRGEDFDDFPRFDLIVNRYNAPVHLGADHFVADGGVNGIGEVDNGRAARQIDNVAARGEYKYVLGDEVALNGTHQFLHVARFLLVVEHLANPREALV